MRPPEDAEDTRQNPQIDIESRQAFAVSCQGRMTVDE